MIRDNNVLVTGAGGFVGRALADYLRGIRPRSSIFSTGRSLPKGPSSIPCDFRRWGQVKALLRLVRPRVVFHCVGTTNPGSWDALFSAHVSATTNLLEAIRQGPRPCPRVVIVGSAAEYGDVPIDRQPIRESEVPHPLSLYGFSKHLQTSLALEYVRAGVPVVVARVFNILGKGMPRSFAVSRFIQIIDQAERRPGRSCRVGALESVRDFVAIRDVCRALGALSRRGRLGEIYNVCSGRPVVMGDVLAELSRLSGVHPKVRPVPLSSFRTSSLRAVGDPSKIFRHVGWRPIERWPAMLKALLA